MDVDKTVSVSKGIFVFKNGLKAASKRSKKKKTLDKVETFSDYLWYQCYSNLWRSLEENIEELNSEMFSSVLSSLIKFIKRSYHEPVTEIPTVALLTGINMPDHGVQFATLAKEIRNTVSPHVTCLQSADCQNLKYLVENMVNQLVISENNALSDEDDKNSLDNHIKRNQCNFSLLNAWYEHSQSLYNNDNSPRNNGKRVIVIIIPDFESFNHTVLQKFILIASSYINVLPFVFVFGVATSLATLHSSLKFDVSSKINIRVFHSQPSTTYLNKILENVFFSPDCPFHLGGKVFNLFIDIFLFYDLSVTGFIRNFKYAMFEHFCYGDVMALCNVNKKTVKDILNKFNHEDCESARHLLSFRRLVESETYENRIKLLTDDGYFKDVLENESIKIRKYMRRLHIFLKCLHILVHDLPRAPLGKQVRELYSVASSKNITKTPEYKECFQLLGFQSKEELCTKILSIVETLSDVINLNNTKYNLIKDFIDGLNMYLNNINNIPLCDEEETVNRNETTDDVVMGHMDRKQLKEKLLGMTKQNKPMNRYEKIRQDVLKFLSETFEVYLVEPSSFYFHEIFFFNDISVQNHIIGIHRSAIHTALNDPHYYFQCTCCEIPNDSVIKACMPDICIAYKLHLECGKMINLYDWLQAFLCIVDPENVEDEAKRIVNPELQARFTQAIAELEFLGFIKSSKRKTDHVTRLTWGG